MTGKRLGRVDLERIAADAEAGRPAEPEDVLALVREVERLRADEARTGEQLEDQRALLKKERDTVRMLKQMMMERGS